jgi:hypothetical protein
MDEQVMVPQAAPTTGSGSLSFRGLAEVFYKPTAFFRELVERPKVLVPYVAFGLILLVFLYLTRELVWEMVSQTPKFAEQMQNSPISPETMHKIFGYQYIFGGLIAMLCVPLLGAALALFWGNFVFAGKGRFKQLLSIVLYGEIIYAIGAIVNLALILPRGNLGANLSLGVLVASQGIDSVVYTALSKVAVFIIWEIIAIGVGLSVLYNTKASRGYLISVLSVGMLSVLHIIFTAVGKMFQG